MRACGRRGRIARDVAAAREKAQSLGVANVEFVEAGFLTYEYRGTPADVVYSRNALHHLPDFWKAIALRRIALMLRPGGVLRLRDLVFAFDADEADRWIPDWLGSAASRAKDGWTRAELESHLSDEHSTFTWLLEPMLERSGFEIKDAEYAPGRIFTAYVCVLTGDGRR